MKLHLVVFALAFTHLASLALPLPHPFSEGPPVSTADSLKNASADLTPRSPPLPTPALMGALTASCFGFGYFLRPRMVEILRENGFMPPPRPNDRPYFLLPPILDILRQRGFWPRQTDGRGVYQQLVETSTSPGEDGGAQSEGRAALCPVPPSTTRSGSMQSSRPSSPTHLATHGVGHAHIAAASRSSSEIEHDENPFKPPPSSPHAHPQSRLAHTREGVIGGHRADNLVRDFSEMDARSRILN